MKKALRISLIVLAAMFAVCSAACVYDGPPKDPDSTEPPAHTGIFRSEHGTMTFGGDGKSVVIDFDRELSELTGLPEGRCEAEYSFLANTPPHTCEYRWDMANEFRITAKDASFTFGNDMGGTGVSEIHLYFVHEEKTFEVDFFAVKDQNSKSISG